MKFKTTDLGLSKKEAEVYLSLVKTNQATASEIAEDLNMKRSSVYIYLTELKKYGLVFSSFQNKKSYFVAENPYKLLSLAERKRQQAQKQEEKIMDIIPMIKSLSKQAKILPKVKHYEGIEGMWTVLEQSLKVKQDQYFIGSFETILKILGRENFTKNYTDKRYKLGNKIYNITDQFKQPQRDYFSDPNFREIKYLPKNIKTSSSVWFYGDKFILFSSNKPYSTTVVESIEITSLLRFMFDFVWQSLK